MWHREGRKMATGQYRSAISLDDVAQKTTLARSAHQNNSERTSKPLEEQCDEFVPLVSLRFQGVKTIDVIERSMLHHEYYLCKQHFSTSRFISTSSMDYVYMIGSIFVLVRYVDYTIMLVFLLTVRSALSRVEHALSSTLPGHLHCVFSSIAWW